MGSNRLLPAGLLLHCPTKPIKPPKSCCSQLLTSQWPGVETAASGQFKHFPLFLCNVLPQAWAQRKVAFSPAPWGCAEWDGTPCPPIAALGETPAVEATGEGGLSSAGVALEMAPEWPSYSKKLVEGGHGGFQPSSWGGRRLGSRSLSYFNIAG